MKKANAIWIPVILCILSIAYCYIEKEKNRNMITSMANQK